VNLAWADNANNETGFTIERCTGANCTNFALLTNVAANTTAFSDLTVAATTTYSYRVFASNLGGNSPRSNVATVTTPVAGPAAPSNLTVLLSTNPFRARLLWMDNATNETGFVMERSVNGGPFTQVATRNAFAGTGNISFTLPTTLTVGNTYTYRVKAMLGTVSSAYSNTATLILAVPAAPTNLAGAAVRIPGNNNNDRVTLTWTDNSTNETGFVIQRSPSPNFNTSLVTINVGADLTTYSQTISRQSDFYYRIRAVNAVGNSGWSNVLFVATP
jgi:predicted phage tail protein